MSGRIGAKIVKYGQARLNVRRAATQSAGGQAGMGEVSVLGIRLLTGGAG
jgi:hypothetical protein